MTVFVLSPSLLQSILPLFPPPPALRSPMSVPPGSYPAHFGVVSHAGLNGELASPGGFGGALTLSPQISAAANAYSRSPMVSKSRIILLCQGLIYSSVSDLTLRLSERCEKIDECIRCYQVVLLIHYVLTVMMSRIRNKCVNTSLLMQSSHSFYSLLWPALMQKSAVTGPSCM